MDLDWTNIANVLLMVASMVLTAKWKGAKDKGKEIVAKVGSKANQAIDLAESLMAAIEDNNISAEEEQKLVAKFKVLLPIKEE